MKIILDKQTGRGIIGTMKSNARHLQAVKGESLFLNPRTGNVLYYLCYVRDLIRFLVDKIKARAVFYSALACFFVALISIKTHISFDRCRHVKVA